MRVGRVVLASVAPNIYLVALLQVSCLLLNLHCVVLLVSGSQSFADHETEQIYAEPMAELVNADISYET